MDDLRPKEDRGRGTYIYGRRTYETMAVWETDPAVAEIAAASDDDATIGAAGRRHTRVGGRVRRVLRLRSERRFGNGVVQATYDVVGHVQP